MSLLRKLNKIVIIQSVLGLFPYKINKHSDKVEYCLSIWFYSILFFCTVSIMSAYTYVEYVLDNGITGIFHDTMIACKFGQFLSLKLIYDCCIIDILYNRKKLATFFNKLNNVDHIIESLVENSLNVAKAEIARIFCIHVFIIVLYFVIYLLFTLQYSVMWSITLSIQVISLTLLSYFIKGIVSIISNRMEIIILTLNRIPLND